MFEQRHYIDQDETACVYVTCVFVWVMRAIDTQFANVTHTYAATTIMVIINKHNILFAFGWTVEECMHNGNMHSFASTQLMCSVKRRLSFNFKHRRDNNKHSIDE